MNFKLFQDLEPRKMATLLLLCFNLVFTTVALVLVLSSARDSADLFVVQLAGCVMTRQLNPGLVTAKPQTARHPALHDVNDPYFLFLPSSSLGRDLSRRQPPPPLTRPHGHLLAEKRAGLCTLAKTGGRGAASLRRCFLEGHAAGVSICLLEVTTATGSCLWPRDCNRQNYDRYLLILIRPLTGGDYSHRQLSQAARLQQTKL
ncbi:hypothetical protein J6590_071991 [Homalodisca vitripennis]|nr:hypothetical protein J6590_071991 [Homalodisca vitripennis]